MKLEREVEFEIEDIVFVKTDEKQLPRMVQGYLIYKNEIKYYLVLGEGSCYFYGFEISKEKSFLANRSQIGFSK